MLGQETINLIAFSVTYSFAKTMKGRRSRHWKRRGLRGEFVIESQEFLTSQDEESKVIIVLLSPESNVQRERERAGQSIKRHHQEKAAIQ